MRRLLAIFIPLVSTFVLAVPGTASASSQCLPVTIDDQPLCVNTSPIDPVLATVDGALGSAQQIVDDVKTDLHDCSYVGYNSKGYELVAIGWYADPESSSMCTGAYAYVRPGPATL